MNKIKHDYRKLDAQHISENVFVLCIMTSLPTFNFLSTEVKNCVVKGPETAEEFIYDLKPFSGEPSTFDLDCKYRILSSCGDGKNSEIFNR